MRKEKISIPKTFQFLCYKGNKKIWGTEEVELFDYLFGTFNNAKWNLNLNKKSIDGNVSLIVLQFLACHLPFENSSLE